MKQPMQQRRDETVSNDADQALDPVRAAAEPGVLPPPRDADVGADVGIAAVRMPAVPRLEVAFLVPVRNMVLFPGVVLPVVVSRQRSIETVQEAVRTEKPIVIVLQRDEKVEEPGQKDLYEVGTVAQIVRYLTTPDGKHHAICQGQERCRVVAVIDPPEPGSRGWRAEIERIVEAPVAGEISEARFLALKAQAQEVLQLSPGAPEDLSNAVAGITSASMLADMVATFLDVTAAEKQEILETFDVPARMEKIGVKLGRLAQVLQLSAKIRQETKGTLDKAQREYFLREQLKQIQKELAGEAGESNELAVLREAIAKSGMPAEVLKEAQKDFARLERMNEAASEYSMMRTYLDVLIELPWSKRTQDNLDIAAARAVLDHDHHGLLKVKRHILEYLAVRKLKPDGRRANLCLVGPPGVGKTSLGQSIARAMGRAFVRVSLGGVHDEAEIRGHRRTYIGAMPGNIVTGMRKAGSMNPVFMLDEMDKLSASFQGDPSAALLEVLDPEQNHTFRDNYLGVPIDLSQVLFIGTANVLEDVPGPLRDRFEIVQLPGYTQAEKIAIAMQYLWPRQLEQNGLLPAQCALDPKALERVVTAYTREAGVRGLDRQLGGIVRWFAARVAEKKARKTTVRVGDLHEILGAPRFEDEVKSRTSVPGVATGLAWTPVGGGILFVEATSMPGKGQLILTGQLGDVMRESAQAALSLVRSRARHLGLDSRFFETHDLHVHLPAGAIPKDGPSAGVTLYTALVSLLSGRNVRSDVAMTGEISLRGLVLPVGGIKEKVLGAHAAGIRTVLLPKRNQPDLEEVPESTRKDMHFVFLQTVDDATEHAFEPEAQRASSKSDRRAIPTHPRGAGTTPKAAKSAARSGARRDAKRSAVKPAGGKNHTSKRAAAPLHVDRKSRTPKPRPDSSS
jgi:ATP-dependent Lon protease